MQVDNNYLGFSSPAGSGLRSAYTVPRGSGGPVDSLPLIRARFISSADGEGPRKKKRAVRVLPYPPGPPGFARWLKRDMPAVHKQLKAKGLLLQAAGLSAAPPAVKESWADRILSAAEKIIPTIYQYRTMEMQLKRAEKGLPPIETADIAPTAKIEVGGQTRRLIIWGGVGLGSLVLLKILMK